MKKISYLILALCLVSFPLVYGCGKDENNGDPNGMKTQPGDRIIQFAGYEWDVRSNAGVQQGPGPNYFSDAEDNAWVDDAGRLHLKITQKNGIWYCSEVTLKKVYGYGRYVFQVESPLGALDKNAVGALFLYKNDHQEIDIEFSKWGIDDNENAQFVVQPGDKTGNKERFEFTDREQTSVHVIDWQQDAVHFDTYNGSMADTSKAGHLIADWTYKGTDNPTALDARLKINVWLLKGMAPADQKEQELIISGFKIL